MAFEDRCSPNQANSPGPVTGRVPAPHGGNMSIDYNQSQYSCTTIDQRYQNQMTVVKVQPVSPPPSPQNQDYQNYYQDKQGIELKQESYEEKRSKQQANGPINFSITNILHPDFGLKKTNKIEGPKPVGPNHSSLYKPYDLSKTDSTNKYQRTYYDYLSRSEESTTPLPPLGGLRQTVSQIGERDRETKVTDLGTKRPDSASSIVSSTSSGTSSQDTNQSQSSGANLWPAWVYCTRYSDRPSSGPRSRRMKKKPNPEEKRPRTAFSATQLARLKHEFAENRYLTERRRQALAAELGLAEAQIKIWFQNKRAKLKKASGQRNPLALQLMAQGLYNHSTVQDSDEDEEINVA